MVTMSKVSHGYHLFINSLNQFFESINLHSTREMPWFLYYFFMSCEYLSYVIATLTIIFTFFLSTEYLYKFFVNKEKPITDILKVRLVIGHILNLALTIILAGHIIRLIYSSNLKTVFFLVVLLLVRELLVHFLDREVQVIYKQYNALLSKEHSLNVRKIGTTPKEEEIGSDLNR